MPNYKLLQQEAEDYAELMGQYKADFGQYQQDVKNIQQGAKDYVLSDPSKPETFYKASWNNGTGKLEGGEATAGFLEDDGRTASIDTTKKSIGPGMGVVSTTSAERYKVLTPPTEPGRFDVTRSEATALQSPPQTLAQAALKAPGVADRLGLRPEVGPSEMGIMGRVMAGKL